MLNIWRSNQLEVLVAEFTKNIRKNKINPLKPEITVVNNMNMGRWINLEISRQTGIAANNKFILPAEFIWKISKAFMPESDMHIDVNREIIFFRIMETLPLLTEKDNNFNTVKNYLKDTNNNIDELKLYHLSRILSDIYDKYSVYRHEWLINWENGINTADEQTKDDADILWQARLWKEIIGTEFLNHRAGLINKFFDFFKNFDFNKSLSVPSTLSIFGVSMLPKAFFDIFVMLSHLMEINLYLLSQCMEYSGDLRDNKTITRLRHYNLKNKKQDVSMYYETGNSILASMGKVSREFLEIIYDYDIDFNDFPIYKIPESASLLHNIQRDILLLQEVSTNQENQKKKIKQNDLSVQIHSCHSIRREVEVLHDMLLRLFEQENDNSPINNLAPDDIIVMAPNIEEYAPFINAIFGFAHKERYIPYSVSDATMLFKNHMAGVLTKLLDMAKSRFKASELLGILELNSIQKKFEIKDTDLEKIRKWVKESGIRWAIDSGHRKDMGFPVFDENSWNYGFNKMFAGYSMPPEEIFLDNATITYPFIEGQEAVLLGKLNLFIDTLKDIKTEISKKRSVEEWQIYINNLIDMMFEPYGDEINLVQEIRNIISNLKINAEKAKFTDKIGSDTIKNYINNEISNRILRGGFLTGKVTFSNIIPMRSIPFKVICLIGMNDESFPGREKPLAFDLMARYPKKGDRNKKHDDRQMFLESIISAGDYLYLSYIGNDINDNSEKNPSVVISELIDYIEKNYYCDNSNIINYITTKHYLQPFSPNYFRPENDKLFSYKSEWLPQNSPNHTNIFINTQITPDKSLKLISLDNFIRFFKHPVKFFFNKILDIYLNEPEEIIPDDETLTVSDLTKYNIAATSIGNIIQNKTNNKEYNIDKIVDYNFKLQTARENLYLISNESSTEIHEKVKTIDSEIFDFLNPFDFNIKIADFELYGTLDNILQDSLITFKTSSRLKATDIIHLWLKHLILNHETPKKPDYPQKSKHIYISKNKDKTIKTICYELNEINDTDKVRIYLESLLKIYWKGISYPICFMPETSYQFAKSLYETKNEQKAIIKALQHWNESSYNHSSESTDKYYQTAFRGNDPLNSPEFAEISNEFFFNIFDCSNV